MCTVSIFPMEGEGGGGGNSVQLDAKELETLHTGIAALG